MAKLILDSVKHITMFLCLSFLSISPLMAQGGRDCTGTMTGLIPLNDLGSNTYLGEQGGLYSGGSNQRPSAHELGGIAQADQVVPRDTLGNYDPVNGKIVLTSIGMSNCRREFGRFMEDASAVPNLNPALVLVNGAEGGMTIEEMVDYDALYWDHLLMMIKRRGLDPDQVQVVWLKQSYRIPDIETFPEFPQMMASDLALILQNIKSHFPNVRLCYLTSRIYGGYTTNYYRSEPLEYESGFGYKWLIENQINGDPTLNYDPGRGQVMSPWLSWGPYMWADGLNLRSDGLFWECKDFEEDGYHPADRAKEKMSDALIEFFSTDPTSANWFLN